MVIPEKMLEEMHEIGIVRHLSTMSINSLLVRIWQEGEQNDHHTSTQKAF